MTAAQREPGDDVARASAAASPARERVAAWYVGWLERHGRAILAVTAAVVAASIYLAAFHLPLHADLSDLLPSNTPAIRDLRRLEARVAAKDTMVAIVVAPDPALRAATADDLAREIGELIRRWSRIDADDDEVRAFVRAHAALYVPLADLIATEHRSRRDRRRQAARQSAVHRSRRRAPAMARRAAQPAPRRRGPAARSARVSPTTARR
jgi:hypothetical protein